MRILQFYDGFNTKGGVERVIATLSNHWVENGYEVGIVARNSTVENLYGLKSEIDKFNFRNSGGKGIRRFIEYFIDIFKIRNSSIFKNSDYIIANGPWCSLLCLLALRFFRSNGGKIFVCNHNSPSAFGKVTNVFMNLIYYKADGIIVLTKQEYELNKNKYKNLYLINNPVENKEINSFSIKRNEKQFLAVGRMTRQKGFDLLLEAWEIVVHKHNDVQLVLIGEGEERLELEGILDKKKLKNNVIFLNNQDDLSSFYLESRAFLLSSRYEGLPLVLLEAITYGLPIIAFDCEYGPREVVIDKYNGLLCKPDDIFDFSKKILFLIENPDEVEKYSENAFESAKKFAIKNVSKVWEDLLNERI